LAVDSSPVGSWSNEIPITLVTVTLWFVVTALSAYFYVINRINSPDADPGYETDRDFHLMFAMARCRSLLAGWCYFSGLSVDEHAHLDQRLRRRV